MITPILSLTSQKSIYMQIRDFIVLEINSGRLKTDEPLPSVRKFSQHLGISRTSVENAYNQLLAEGYIISRPKRGYFVEALDIIKVPRKKSDVKVSEKEKVPALLYDFTNGLASMDTFDFGMWKKHINHVINYDEAKLYEPTGLKGESQLREAISHQFYRSRGVIANTDNIVVGSGVSPLLSMLLTLFSEKSMTHIAVEDPGFNKAYGVFRGAGFDVTPIEMTFEGMKLNELEESTCRVCYVSPSHHFPTGTIMSIKDRQRIIKWAKLVDGYVIEDDYNFQLRYEGQPIPSMQSMDGEGRVIYLGSFSTVLAPAIRISFMVLPDSLKSLFEKNDSMFPQTASKLEQLALARLIQCGDFEKHIRKMRLYYAKLQKCVLNYMEDYFPYGINPIFIKAGLQIILELPEHINEEDLEHYVLSKRMKVEGLNRYRIKDRESRRAYLVFSYRGITEKRLEEAIKALGKVLGEMI